MYTKKNYLFTKISSYCYTFVTIVCLNKACQIAMSNYTHKGKYMKTLLTAAFIALTTTAVFAQDAIQITGSSTVLPFSTIAAESFGENWKQNSSATTTA